MGRQVKKTVIKYASLQKTPQKNQQNNQTDRANNNRVEEERQRSREKPIVLAEQNSKKQVTVDVNSRKARLQAMRKAREEKEKEENEKLKIQQFKEGNNETGDIKIVIVQNEKPPLHTVDKGTTTNNNNLENSINQQETQKAASKQPKLQISQQHYHPSTHSTHHFVSQPQKQNSSSQSESENSNPRILHKPVFLSKQDRSNLNHEEPHPNLEEERRKKTLKYTTKLLLEETLRKDQDSDSEHEIDNLNDDEDQTNLPDDSDDKNEELEYELWKIRELKRIRRDREIRQKHFLEKVEIERRRQMNNEQILLENRLLGSDSISQETQTKYVFMQKYYHKGAFYQDSSDPIFQRDYNLPTPMEMQDKSALPQVLQKRKGNFGKRGQSKYTHLTAEDTTDTNPLTRADQSLLNSWKQKMAGYKK